MKRKNISKTSIKETGSSHFRNFEFIFGKLFESFNEEQWTAEDNDDFENAIISNINFQLSDYYTEIQNIILNQYKSFEDVYLIHRKTNRIKFLGEFYKNIFGHRYNLKFSDVYVIPTSRVVSPFQKGYAFIFQPIDNKNALNFYLYPELQLISPPGTFKVKALNISSIGNNFFSTNFKKTPEYRILKDSCFDELDPDLWVKEQLSKGGIIKTDNFYTRNKITFNDFKKPLDWWYDPEQIGKLRILLTLYIIYKIYK